VMLLKNAMARIEKAGSRAELYRPHDRHYRAAFGDRFLYFHGDFDGPGGPDVRAYCFTVLVSPAGPANCEHLVWCENLAATLRLALNRRFAGWVGGQAVNVSVDHFGVSLKPYLILGIGSTFFSADDPTAVALGRVFIGGGDRAPLFDWVTEHAPPHVVDAVAAAAGTG
jgi:hypothetical protein